MASTVSDLTDSRGTRGSRTTCRDSRESQLDLGLLRSETRETVPLLTSGIRDAEALSRSVQRRVPVPNAQRRRFSWWQFCYSRIPKGKAVFLVLAVSTIETFAFFGAVDGIIRLVLGSDVSTTSLAYSISILLQYTAGRLFYPLGGFLADVYLGRYRVIHYSLWLLWVAFSFLALALSLNGLPHVPRVLTRYVLPVVAFVLISLGSAGFEANIIPFGAEQLPQGATSEEISSYFYWWLFTKQLGILAGIGVFIGLFLPSYTSLTNSTLAVDFEMHTVSAIQPMVAVLVITTAILLHVCCEGWYFKDRERENPIKLVLQVVIYAAFARRQPPRNRRAFRYGETPKPRIELAKEDYDGIFSGDEVEDVKTFCRILLVIFSLTGLFASYSAAYVMMSYQMSSLVGMIARPSPLKYYTYVFPALYNIFDGFSVLIYLPLVNNLIIPCFPLTSIKKRLGFGSLVHIVALISAVYVQWGTSALDSEHILLWLLIPGALLPLFEVLIFVTGLEFIYAQAPQSMKGLLIGLLYFNLGLWNGGAAFFFYHYPFGPSGTYSNSIIWYYVMYAIVAFLGFVAYCVVAGLYVNRRRPAPNEEDDKIRPLYQDQRY